MNMNSMYNKISKEDFLRLKEEDLVFITNPGRMGDENGSTFIIRHDNEFTIYRVEGWLYPPPGTIVEIKPDDVEKQFPKWLDAWKHSKDENYKGKYTYLYMGFGNGLSVDNSIYKIYEPYLNKLVEKYIEDKNREDLKYAAIFNVWLDAFLNMIEEKGYILKK